ncbi:MAG TPA: hydroxysqualene dehydroxylase HpnE [Solirubrobacteraceae bacterium]|nr:hydroxysqualene dehydroxylase HpnE [Solirubrobacteraceae bacterium]
MTRRVVVVGGGLAGITAALDCVDAGAAVSLVEVRPRLGGAAYSFQRDGLWLDNGQHVFLRCCAAYRELLDRLGTTSQTVLQDRLAIPVLAPGRPAAWVRRTGLPAPLHLGGSLIRYRHLRFSERVAAIRAALALSHVDPQDEAAEATSFGDWLGEHGQSPRALEKLWELITRPTLNLRLQDASLAAAAFVFRTGYLDQAEAGDLGYARTPLQRVHGDAALSALQSRGVDVRLAWRSEGIEASAEAGFVVTGPGDNLTADAVVLAVPHERAAGLAPGALRREASARWSALGTSPIVNLHVVYDRPVLALEFAAAVDSPVQFVFDRTESSGLQRGQCLAISLSAADHEAAAPAEELRVQFERALAELLPAARQARIENFVVTREHSATFRAAPGAQGLRPGARTSSRGLALAGAWTDTGWPATMEGAVRSGHAAAEVALSAIGTERAPVGVAA